MSPEEMFAIGELLSRIPEGLPPARKSTPFCCYCGTRKVAGTPRNRETRTCRRCYDANHSLHLCPIEGCPICDG